MVNLKEQVGIKAAEFVKDGMIVGLGTGSTAYYFVAELGRRIKEEGLQITAVTTSSVTYDQAESLGIPLKRTIPIAPSPRGVEIAAMVSNSLVIMSFLFSCRFISILS